VFYLFRYSGVQRDIFLGTFRQQRNKKMGVCSGAVAPKPGNLAGYQRNKVVRCIPLGGQRNAFLGYSASSGIVENLMKKN